jgi:hypothetical protein
MFDNAFTGTYSGSLGTIVVSTGGYIPPVYTSGGGIYGGVNWGTLPGTMSDTTSLILLVLGVIVVIKLLQ